MLRRSQVVSAEGNDLLLRRPLHAFLVVFLPDLRPWAVVHIRHLVWNDGARDTRFGASVDWKDRLNALDEGVGFAGFESAVPLERADHSDWFNECFRIVKDAFVVQAEEFAGLVATGGVDFDGRRLARELRVAVHFPALDVRRPGDQRVSVPEADRVAVP